MTMSLFKCLILITPGWQTVNITLENMTHYLPRMGYLFSDGLFDLAKVEY